MQLHRFRSAAASVLLASLSFAYHGRSINAQAQTSDAPLVAIPNHSPASWTGAANRWRLTAIDPRKQLDPVSASIRNARNDYWREQLTTIRDIEAHGSHVLQAPGLYSDSLPEITTNPEDAWVIATFETFKVIPLDGDDTLLYTEAVFRVDQSIHVPRAFPLAVGGTFEYDFPGGKVKLPDGKTYASQLAPTPFALQPNHRYLLQLSSVANGLFYQVTKDWDLTSGKVVPNRQDEVVRASKNKSTLAGLPESAVPEAVRAGLAAAK